MMLEQLLLIFRKELRDQLRDRRTLLVILGVPTLLYPLLAFGMARTMNGLRNAEPVRVAIANADRLPSFPPLLTADGTRFADFLHAGTGIPGNFAVEPAAGMTEADLRSGRIDVLATFPANTREELAAGRGISVQVLRCGVDERAEAGYGATLALLDMWSKTIVGERVVRLGKSLDFAHPIQFSSPAESNLATAGQQASLLWGRLVPFVLVMMALTGAFYPAIDLCAGEKERGTLETLLVSPAARGNIVCGKFLCVWLFSVVTSLLNLTSMAASVAVFGTGIPGLSDKLAAPPLAALVGSALLLTPLAAMFAALCVALSAFARSAKEGQYYLMPLFLLATPLVFFTMAPGVTISWATAAVPVANIALLIRALLAEDYARAVWFAPLALAATTLYGVLALRWAIQLFHREETLFRDAERADAPRWLRHLLRNKEPLPDFPEAAFAALLAFALAAWASGLGLTGTLGGTAAALLAFVIAPAAFLATLLTSAPLKTLRLQLPALPWWFAATGLGLLMHPALAAMEAAARAAWGAGAPSFAAPLGRATPWWIAFATLGILRVAAEELLFRGFVLSGLARRCPEPLAIAAAAMLGAAFQFAPARMPAALAAGLAAGVLSQRTGSIWPGAVLQIALAALQFPYRHEGLPGNPFQTPPDEILLTLVAGAGAFWALRRVAARPVAPAELGRLGFIPATGHDQRSAVG